jgi:hypothetical protein
MRQFEAPNLYFTEPLFDPNQASNRFYKMYVIHHAYTPSNISNNIFREFGNNGAEGHSINIISHPYKRVMKKGNWLLRVRRGL